ncbi:bifunctional PIG-L family deacetylase/class I SAM-dependent methyltransferase [Leifsonia shinshuensis]|uniref:LmbE family N-acetylglucosaminyl deacetylase n=1 Tax=Leifsonia shinshuensis TaxID=150026 RepID=A0A853CPX2_9MICO|nr:bifunctional PIG-L family deacetylase/class I SAM-dependent methyltransferase [Leifsonia shinshuensis]NYJ22308.1 LmbE family N-acetylglucosaminyl deacetylase [Leifsonia shinshuensis]
MVTFDPLVAATPAAVWEDPLLWASVPSRTREWLAGFTRIVVFSAHPDDETLGVGGLLVLAGELGIDVSVIVATSERDERLVELTAALSRLGSTTDLTVLGLTDGALKNEASLLRDGVDLALASRRGDTTLVLAPWPGDRHGDHRTLGREVAAACAVHGDRLLLYPIWLWQWGSPEDLPWGRASEVELTASARERKRAALSAFTSQLHTAANPDGVLTREFVERAVHGREVLFEPEESAIGDHFEALHRVSADPWAVRTRWYERRKRELTCAVLPKERYARGFEIGCSNGEMSALLAARCETLLSVDGAPTAVALATERTRAAANVTVKRMHVPEEWPDGSFDLVVVSEVAYYLAPDQWAVAIDRILGSLADGGQVVLCHWTGHADDFAQSGWDAHAAFANRSGLRVLVQHHDEDFLLEVFG